MALLKIVTFLILLVHRISFAAKIGEQDLPANQAMTGFRFIMPIILNIRIHTDSPIPYCATIVITN